MTTGRHKYAAEAGAASPEERKDVDTASPLDRPLINTLFPTQAATRKRERRMSLRELEREILATEAGSKKGLPWLKLAGFGGERSPLRPRRDGKGLTGNSLRTNANTLTVSGAECDYDGGQIALAEAAELLRDARVAGMLYTTPSSTASAPRWRGFFPFSEDLPPAERGRLVARLNGLFGGALDPSSFTLSQAFYAGSVAGQPKIETALVDGRYLDLAADLDMGAVWPKGVEEREPGEPSGEKTGLTEEQFADAVRAVPNDSKFDDRKPWLGFGMAIHHETDGSEDGFDLFDAWSEQHPSYDPDKTREAWDSFYRPRATGKTVVRHARENGWTDSRLLDMLTDDDARDGEELALLDGGDGGATLARFLEARSNGTATKAPAGLVMLTPDECEPGTAPSYIVKGLIEAGNIIAVVGAPGVGKSVVTPALAYAVAQGRPVFGMRTRPGGVFYIAAENETDMRRRVHVLREEHGPADAFRLVLGGGGQVAEGTRFLKALRNAVKKERPTLIVIDTLPAARPGLDENDSKGMGEAIALAQSLTRWGAAVLLVHHDSKAGDGLPRGHSSLHGILDASLALVRGEDGVIRGSCTKNRAGPSHRELLAFRNRVVTIGVDEDGEALRTVVCEELVDAGPREAPLAPSVAAALAILTELLEGQASVPEEVWRAACVDGRAVSAAPDADSRRRAFKRASEDLVRRERVVFKDGCYSLPEPWGSTDDDV